MAASISFSNTSNGAITTISFGNLDRTVQSPTQTVRIWNDLAGAGGATTATAVMIFPEYQMEAGAPFLSSAIEPADNQWLYCRLNGTIQNPTGATGSDYASVSTGFFPVGGRAYFLLPNIPPRFGRELEFYMLPSGTGSATSINAMKIAVLWGRGVYALETLSQSRDGDFTVFRAEPNRYALIGGQEMLGGCQVKTGLSSTNNKIVERGSFCLGGIPGTTELWEVPATDDWDGAGAALAGGSRYSVLLTKNPTGFSDGAQVTPAIAAANWTVGAGWAALGVTLNKNADGTGTAAWTSGGTDIVAGTSYRVRITLNAWTVGSATYTLGGVNGGSTLGAATTYENIITASTTAKLIITPTNTSRFEINAVSIVPLCFTVTKGSQALTGSEIVPAAPSANHIPIASWSKIDSTDGDGTTTAVDLRKHDNGWLTADGVGLDADVGPYINTQSGAMQFDEGEQPVSGLTASDRNRILLSGQNVLSDTIAAPTAGQTLLGHAVTGVANTSSLSQRRLHKAPNLYRARRHKEVVVSDGEYRNDANEIYLFGDLRRVLQDQSLVAGGGTAVLSNANGRRGIVRIKSITTPANRGTIRFIGTSINGTGTEVAVTEDHTFNKTGDWIFTTNRYLGTGANTRDITIGSLAGPAPLAGTDVVVDGYVGDVWYHPVPVHVAALAVDFTPLTNAAQIKVQLFKMPASGRILKIYDSGLKSSFTATGAIATSPGSLKQSVHLWLDTTPAEITSTITVVDFTLLAGDTLTITTDIGATVLTEGVEWTAAVDEATTAASLLTAIQAITGLDATRAGAVITLRGFTATLVSTATSDAVNLTRSDATDTATLTDTTLDSTTDSSIVWSDPYGLGEGLIGRISEIVDIGAIRATLHCAELIIP